MSLLRSIQIGPNRTTAALITLPLVLTSLGFTAYKLYVAFPPKPETLRIHPGLSSLPKTGRSSQVYSEDYFGTEGGYAHLPFGKVKYWLLGPEDGVKVTLIAGLSIPAIIWKDVAPQLVARGFRVLLYDLYGRGYSDAPELAYDTALYTTQLALLLQHLKWEKTNLVGLSMGGAIATSFVDTFPNLVSSHVAFLASAGMVLAEDLPWNLKFKTSPFFMTCVNWYRQYRTKNLVSSGRTHDLPDVDEIVELQSAFLPHYSHAIASSLRCDSVRGVRAQFSSLEYDKNGITPDEAKKVLVIHGTHDRSIPFVRGQQIYATLPQKCRDQARFVTIEGAGHGLTTAQADVVGKELIAFLEENKVGEQNSSR